MAFLDLRDASGVTQVVVREDEAMHLRNEYVLKVVGTVGPRPEGNENPQLPTGDIEVTATSNTWFCLFFVQLTYCFEGVEKLHGCEHDVMPRPYRDRHVFSCRRHDRRAGEG